MFVIFPGLCKLLSGSHMTEKGMLALTQADLTEGPWALTLAEIVTPEPQTLTLTKALTLN